MKRCYEMENYEADTGSRATYNHCGGAVKGDNGLYYCTHNGKLEGYGGSCADINLRAKEGEQLGLFELSRL